MKIAFRELRADEVDARVSTINDKGLSLLLYKDARCDMNILDETVGPMNWEREHEIIGDRLYCTVSIFDEDKNAWVSKQDVGTESYTEKEKGRHQTASKEHVSIGESVESYTQHHHLFGLMQTFIKKQIKVENLLLMTSSV